MTTRPERFGLTLVEAMACGTPVLGARMGSIPEIVVNGVTGFLATASRTPWLRCLYSPRSIDVPAAPGWRPSSPSSAWLTAISTHTRTRYDDRPRTAQRGAARSASARLVGPPDGVHGDSTETEKPRPLMTSRIERDYSGRTLYREIGVRSDAHVAIVGIHDNSLRPGSTSGSQSPPRRRSGPNTT